jgi:hypothetical protein
VGGGVDVLLPSSFHPSIVFPLLPPGSHFMNYYMNVPPSRKLVDGRKVDGVDHPPKQAANGGKTNCAMGEGILVGK